MPVKFDNGDFELYNELDMQGYRCPFMVVYSDTGTFSII